MSEGARMPLSFALNVAEFLHERWDMGDDCIVVGSVRRERAWVGDIEFSAPWREGTPLFQGDVLYETILEESKRRPDFVRVKQGLNNGFSHLRLIVHGKSGNTTNVEIYRYKPGQRGWATIMRTGPSKFGQCVLAVWHKRMGLAKWDKASEKGWLRDAEGKAVHHETEQEVFDAIGVPFVEPKDRDSFDWRRYL